MGAIPDNSTRDREDGVPVGKEAGMSTHTQPCEYQECQCTVTGGVQGANYCSEVCRARDSEAEEMSVGCACGHSPCDGPD